jgi:hypothetical protein
LIQEMSRYYPAAAVELHRILYAHQADFQALHNEIFNAIIWNVYRPEWEHIFNGVCQQLKTTGKKEDTIIARLLEPNLQARWDTAQAYRALMSGCDAR